MDSTSELSNHDGRPSEPGLSPVEPGLGGTQPDPLLRLWRPIAEHLGLIVLFTAASTVSAFLLARFCMIPSYRGEALLRPAGIGAGAGLAAVGSLAGASYASGMMELMASYQAEEYLAIMKSYAFTASLLKEFDLAALFPKARSWRSSSRFARRNPEFEKNWTTYEIVRSEFDCEYDRLTDNMVLHFVNSDPAVTQRVLEAYVEGLRERLRSRAIQAAKSASASLMDEAQRTGDSMLQKQLYEVVARQIERQKLAQVQADFAFTVIEPPVVPTEPYSPRPILDGALAGMTAFTLLAILFASRELFKGHEVRIKIWPL